MKKIIFSIAFVAISLSSFAQVGVGTVTPNANAALDVVATDKGMLPPRVALTGTANFAPLSAHVAGMIVYNTATAADVNPGQYYNDGAKWVRFADAGAGASNFKLEDLTTDAGSSKTATIWREGGLVVSNYDDDNNMYYGSSGKTVAAGKGYVVISKEFTDPNIFSSSTPVSTLQLVATINPTTQPTASADGRAFNSRTYIPSTNTFNYGSLYGGSTSATHNGTGTVGNIKNLLTASNASPGGLVTKMSAIQADATNDKAGAKTTDAIAVESTVTNNSTGIMTNAYAIKTKISKGGSATTTNAYGVYIGDVAGTNRWGVYQADSANNYFAGNVIMSATATTPTTKLDVRGYLRVSSADTLGDATPVLGMIRYNSSTNIFQGYALVGGVGIWVNLH